MSAAAACDPIRLQTRFGDFQADQADIITFPAGLPGFEACRSFVVLSGATSLQCLHALSGPPASFLTIDPRFAMPAFLCRLSPGDRARLGAEADTPLLWLALVTVDAAGRLYANLRAPVVINPATMRGFQIAPHDALYPLRHPLDPR